MIRNSGTQHVDLGFMRLTDAAPVIVAQELGYFREAGISATLHQEVSWASVRDKLVAGALDAAPLLAPLLGMMTLGASGVRTPLLSGLVLSRNGNAITLSSQLAGEVRSSQMDSERIVRAFAEQPITLGTVHAFSSHTLLLRRWLRRRGINPDKGVRFLVVPPSQMVDSLNSGLIDGFCAGEPWNTLAVLQGVGEIVAIGSQLRANAPEKVLAVTRDWHEANADLHRRLRWATLRSCVAIENGNVPGGLAEILSESSYLDLPVEIIRPALEGRIQISNDQYVTDEKFMVFSGASVNSPDVTATMSGIRHCMEMMGKDVPEEMAQSIVHQVCRVDLYRQTVTDMSSCALVST